MRNLKKKTKKKRSKRKKLLKKRKKLLILLGSIILLTIGILISYFTINFIYGWTLTDRSIDGSSVVEVNYAYGKQNSIKFNDPARFGYCFADISFHIPYTEGMFSFYLLITDKSQLNINMDFVGSNGVFARWQDVQSHVLEEYKWYKFDYVYNYNNNVSSYVYVNDVLTSINMTSIIPTNDISQIFIKTNDDGIAEFYINIINIT